MKERGITLIALIITIIILLILAGVTINVILGENGLFNIAKQAGEDYKQAGAREKLEAVLVELQADKITKPEYNEKDYIDNRLKQNNMEVEGDIVTVEGWQFEIDRSIPEIAQSLGKETELKKDTRGKAKFVYDNETQNVAKVEVTIEIDASISGYTVQYNIVENSDTSTNWVDYTAGSTIEVRKNITIYGRIIDKTTNEVGYKFSGKISTIDETAPQAATITFDKTETDVNQIIQATVTQSDLESGIDITNCKYIVNQSSDKLGKDNEAWNSALNFNENPKKINVIESNPGTYYLHILSVDRAGNKIESISKGIVFKGVVKLFNGNLTDILRGGKWLIVGQDPNDQIRVGNSNGVYVISSQKIDVKNYDKLTLSYTSSSAGASGHNSIITLGLLENPDSTEYVASFEKKYNVPNGSRISVELDVSELSDSYYIKFWLKPDGNASPWAQSPFTLLGE